jgi:hypothetical protein
MKRMTAAIAVILALACGLAYAAAPALTTDTLTACHVTHFSDGSCMTTCIFRDAKGDPAGYVHYGWC